LETVIKPAFKIIYNQKNITADITPYLLSLTYNDNVTGESDEVNLVFDDTDHLWQNTWYPNKGDKLKVSIGYNSDLIDCGTFQIDEFELNKNPDQVSIKAIGAGIKKSLRTRKSKAHEKKVLSQIVKSVATSHNLTVIGNIKNIEIDRVTQNNESDLSFLNRLATDYGYYFTVKDEKLIFYNKANIQNYNPICGISYSNLTGCTIRDKTIGIYKDASVSYANPDTGETVQAEVKSDELLAWPLTESIGQKVTGNVETGIPVTPKTGKRWYDYHPELITNDWGFPLKYTESDINSTDSEDTLTDISKAENQQQAEEMAKSQLYAANERAVEGSITLPGVQYFVAGVNFLLVDALKFSGVYHIVKCSHTITKDGAYTTSADIRRIKKLKDA
jgi:phage protein D